MVHQTTTNIRTRSSSSEGGEPDNSSSSEAMSRQQSMEKDHGMDSKEDMDELVQQQQQRALMDPVVVTDVQEATATQTELDANQHSARQEEAAYIIRKEEMMQRKQQIATRCVRSSDLPEDKEAAIEEFLARTEDDVLPGAYSCPPPEARPALLEEQQQQQPDEEFLNGMDSMTSMDAAAASASPFSLTTMEEGNLPSLVQALPVDDSQAGQDHQNGDAILPIANEVEVDKNKPSFHNSKEGKFAIVAAVVLVVIVCCVAIPLLVVKEIHKNQDNALSPSAGGTAAPKSLRSILIQNQIEERLQQDRKVKWINRMEQALNWIIHDDPQQLDANATNLYQRFVLAHFYFETSQNYPWAVCNPPNQNEDNSCSLKNSKSKPNLLGPPKENEQTMSSRWLFEDHECLWAGVQCNTNKQVDGIILDGNHLSGSLPEELFQLPNLNTLSFNWNKLHGDLPSNLYHLKYISLLYNKYSGTIPQKWFESQNIRSLAVGGNNFKGTIPTEVSQMTSLETLVLERNHMSGTIPTEIGLLSSLQDLRLDENPILGSLPVEMSSLPNLQFLSAKDTSLNGSLPVMASLTVLDLSWSRFSGTLSADYGKATELTSLVLIGNAFTGTIPVQLGQLHKLKKLHIQDNQFEGQVPDSVCNLVGPGFPLKIIADCAVRTADNGITIPPQIQCDSSCCYQCCNVENGVCT